VSTEDSSPLTRTSTYNPEPIDNPLNQYVRIETSSAYSVNTGQGYRFDDDGNMIEAYIAADMDCNGVINSADDTAFELALNHLYEEGGYYDTYPTCNHLNGDLDGDGDVDEDDDALFGDYRTGHSAGGATRQAYAWDGENRLITVGPPDDMTPVNGTKQASYAYDYLGRRIWKQVETYQGTYPNGSWVVTEQRKFVYAGTGTGGWLMLMELNALQSNAVVRKYTWGLDLAGQNGASSAGPPSPANAGYGAPALQGAGGTRQVYAWDAENRRAR
jgi:hypothetical protein